jgi:hypothetical protein
VVPELLRVLVLVGEAGRIERAARALVTAKVDADGPMTSIKDDELSPSDDSEFVTKLLVRSCFSANASP